MAERRRQQTWRGLRLQAASTSRTLSNSTISASSRALFILIAGGIWCTAAGGNTCSYVNHACILKDLPQVPNLLPWG